MDIPPHLQVFCAPRFFDDASCRRLRAAMDCGIAEAAEVLESAAIVREEVRRAASIEIDTETCEWVESALDGHRGRLGAYFGLRLEQREGPSFLRYPHGGFYRPHRDQGGADAWADAARRRIAMVLFLNSASGDQQEFTGGRLRLWDDHGSAPLDIAPEAGLLVAFPATMLHEVTVVAGGSRDTVVDWFY